MIVFEFDEETHDSDGSLLVRPLYWLSCTSCTGQDESHSNEIYEQLEAQTCGLTEEI